MFNINKKRYDSMNIDFVSILRILGTGTSSLSPHPCSNIRNKVAAKDKQMKASSAVIVLTITVCILSLFLTSSIISPNVYAADNIKNSSLIVTKQGSFVDSSGRFNILGVVDNIGHVPVQVNMGLKTKDMNSGLITTMIQPTYGKIIYPLTGAPFKFVVDDHNNSVIPSKAYISSIKETPTPYFKSLRLNYTNTPVGKDRSLVGTVKNIGSVDVHDVSVFASAHDNKTRQIDSVKSNPIPVIKPGEEVAFSANPDPAEGPKILYYSCAEIDLHPGGMNTLDMGNGKTIAYDLHGIVSVSDFKYVSATDSLVFGVKHWNPTGGPMSLKIAKTSGAQDISVLMDGKMNNKDVSIKVMNPQTVHIDFIIPPGNHDIQVKGL
jgi:hypothetical protein